MNTPTRSMNRRCLLLALSVGTALALTSAPAQAAPPVTVTCGQTLTQSVKLANDLTDCPGDGLVIGADNITVDLNGHTLDGAIDPATDCDVSGAGPTGTGINNQAGHDGLTIANGTLQQFADGFRGGSNTTGMSDSRLHHLIARDNRDAGIGIGRGSEGPSEGPPNPPNSDNRIDHNVVSDNNRCGFGLGITLGDMSHGNQVAHNREQGSIIGIIVCCAGSDRNVIEHNTVSDNDALGVLVGFGNDSHSAIRHNAVSGNDDLGLLVGDQHARIQHNRVFENTFAGIVLDNASDSDVSKNRVARNGDGVNVSGNGIRVNHNTVSDAVGCEFEEEPGVLGCGNGISVENGEGNVVADNKVARARRDTIRVASFGGASTVGTVVRNNDARDAGVDGISVGTEGEDTVTDTLIQGNLASGVGDDGFDIEIPSTTLTRNRALHNHDLGIEAVPGVTDGGGNKAAGNGNPLQCTNVFCN